MLKNMYTNKQMKVFKLSYLHYYKLTKISVNMNTHKNTSQEQFFNVIVRNSYEVALFLYGPQDRPLATK